MSVSDIIIYGSLTELEIELKHGVKLDVIDEYGFTPLIQTAIVDDADKAELLLDYKANVNFRDLTGGSALHWAVENTNLYFCDLLFRYGADANAYTFASEPVLVKALLRRKNNLKKILLQAGAKLEFAQDYINAKLLGHRFELVGFVDIVDHQQKFTEVDFEGFILEFTLSIILESLREYQNNFSARHLRGFFDTLQKVIEAFSVSAQLIRYQQYQVDLEKVKYIVDDLLDQDILIIPIAYEGHAISWIKYGNLLAKCDRSKNDLFVDNIAIYQITRPQVLTKNFLKQVMYRRQTKDFIDVEAHRLLGLKKMHTLTIGSQISGNCSWANIESAVPVIWYLLNRQDPGAERQALAFYYQWLEWDKDRALQFCLKSFETANPARKASKAAILAAILFQRCSANVIIDIERAMKIIKALKTPDYEYVLNSYIEIYCYQNPCPAGENLQKLLEMSRSYF